MTGIVKLTQIIQTTALALLLVFGPLTGGATKPWSFSISLWLALTGLVAMAVKRMWADKSILPRHPFELPMLILLGLAVISLFATIHPLSTFWALLRLITYLAVFYLALDATASRTATKQLIGLIIGVGVVLCFIGLIKYFNSPIPGFWSYVPQSQEGFFLSTYLNHNHIAGYLAMALALGMGMMLSNSFSRGLAWLGCTLLFLVCVVLTMSRGGWISIGISVIFMVASVSLKKKSNSFRVMAIGFILVAVVGLALLGSSPAIQRVKSLEDHGDSSRVNRIGIWTASLNLIKHNPLFGTGLGTFPYSFPTVRPPGAQLRYNEAHSDYLQIVIELGLPVLIPLIWWLFLFFKVGLSHIRKSNTSLGTAVSLGTFGGALAIIIHSAVDFNIQLTANGVLFFSILGMMAGADRFRAVRKEKVKDVEIRGQTITSLDFVDAEGNLLASKNKAGSKSPSRGFRGRS